MIKFFAFSPPFLSHSLSASPCASFSFSLSLEKFIPMVASAASNALTSASDLSSALVIRQDSYLSGSPTASLPLSFYPPLIFITSSFFSPSASFPFILKLLACSLFFSASYSFALLLLLSFITLALQLFEMVQSHEKLFSLNFLVGHSEYMYKSFYGVQVISHTCSTCAYRYKKKRDEALQANKWPCFVSSIVQAKGVRS